MSFNFDNSDLEPVGNYAPNDEQLASEDPTHDLWGSLSNFVSGVASNFFYPAATKRNTDENIKANITRQEDQQKFQVGLTYLQEELRQESQSKIAQLNSQLRLEELEPSHEYNVALQAYRSACEEKLAQLNDRLVLARQKDQQQFTQNLQTNQQQFSHHLQKDQQQFSKSLQEHEQEFARTLQWELAQFRRETERELALFQSKLAFKQRLIASVFEKLETQLRVHPVTTLQSHQQRLSHGKTIPLTILTSPPAIKTDTFAGDSSAVQLEQVEERLLQSNRQFLNQYYPLNSAVRPVEHLGGAWKSKAYYGEAGVKDLHTIYSAIPTLFLESAVSGEQLNFNFAFWFPNHSEVTYQTVFSTDYVEILCHFAKLKAVEWAKIRQKYLQFGKTEAEIAKRNPVAEFNLRALKLEEEDRLIGVHFPSKHYGYQLGEGTQYFCQFLAVCHQIIIGLMADVYHLLYSLPKTEGEITKPLLPQLLPNLLQQLPQDLPTSVIPDLINGILGNYRHAYEVLGEELEVWIPDLTLDLAHSLNALEDKSWSAEQAKFSLRQWLKQKGVTLPETVDPSVIVEQLAILRDPLKYSDSLEQDVRERFNQQSVTFPEDVGKLLTKADLPYLEKFGVFLDQLRLEQEIVWKASYPFEQLLTCLESLILYQFEVITLDSKGQENSRQKKQAEGYVEDLGNGVFLKMVYIPSGEFVMGGTQYREMPRHQVSVRPFCMGIYPITQTQWKAVELKYSVESNLPVKEVSWYEAKEFCAHLSKYTGKDYRLPSEAEWEYACRAGTQTLYSFGDDPSQLDNYAWFKRNSDGRIHPVGQKKPNAWGLYDMHGNVWEWCLDDWHENYKGAPAKASSWLDNSDTYKMLRGGSWNSNAILCSSASRDYDTLRCADYKYGFRVVC